MALASSRRISSVPSTVMARSPSNDLSPCVGEDHLGRLLGDHVHGADDEEARDLREHGGVDDAQARRATDTEVGVQDRHWIVPPADRARARGVVPPGIVAHELLQRLAIVLVLAGQLLLSDVRTKMRGERADELDAADDRVEILGAAARAFFEVMEIDQRRIAGIGRSQRDGAAPILGVGLEDRPGEIVAAPDQVAMAWEVALESAEERKHEEIRYRPLGPRTLDHHERGTVRGIDAALPLLPCGVALIAAPEFGSFQHFPVPLEAVDDTDLVAILEIFADPGPVDAHRDLVALKLVLRADARQHQQLRRIERAA